MNKINFFFLILSFSYSTYISLFFFFHFSFEFCPINVVFLLALTAGTIVGGSSLSVSWSTSGPHRSFRLCVGRCALGRILQPSAHSLITVIDFDCDVLLYLYKQQRSIPKRTQTLFGYNRELSIIDTDNN